MVGAPDVVQPWMPRAARDKRRVALPREHRGWTEAPRMCRRRCAGVCQGASRLARMGVLRLREFRLLFGAQAVSWFGDRMVAISLAFAVLGLAGSASDVGLVLAFRMVPLVATLLAGGVIADRLSRS